MSRLVIVAISIVALCVVAPLFAQGGAQQKRTRYGPVVRAYLTGLAEELNELEYQLRNHEIEHLDYERSKRRLTIIRFYVEHFASQSGEDLVPELQVLADHELSALGLDEKPDPDRLRVGDLPGGGWRLISIERGAHGQERYFIFKRPPLSEAVVIENVPPSNKTAKGPGKKYDPRSVIETIVVPDRQIPSLATVPPSRSDSVSNGDIQAATETMDPSASGKAAPSDPKFQPPQILSIYLPSYTDEARNRGISGEVIIRGVFLGNGKVKDIRVIKGIGGGLDQQAVESIKRAKFQPAQIDGRVVDASMQIVFNFKFGQVAFYIMMAEPEASVK